MKNKKLPNWVLPVLLVFSIILMCGFLRIYYGGGIGIKIVPKQSFSFKDTIVNLDEIFGMPRIVVASKHPAVKRQLEKMGLAKTDEEVENEALKKLKEEINKMVIY